MRGFELELHIGEIVLEGFSHLDPAALEQAVRQELTRLLMENGLPYAPAGGGEVAHLDGGTFQLPPHADVQTIGAHIARSVAGSLFNPASRKEV